MNTIAYLLPTECFPALMSQQRTNIFEAWRSYQGKDQSLRSHWSRSRVSDIRQAEHMRGMSAKIRFDRTCYRIIIFLPSIDYSVRGRESNPFSRSKYIWKCSIVRWSSQPSMIIPYKRYTWKGIESILIQQVSSEKVSSHGLISSNAASSAEWEALMDHRLTISRAGSTDLSSAVPAQGVLGPTVKWPLLEWKSFAEKKPRSRSFLLQQRPRV